MFRLIKRTFITLGVASGMTAGALFYLTGVDQCRVIVLKDLEKHRAFQNELSHFEQTQDFLTELSRGR